MPGVHVQTLSQLNWLNQEKESLLTIPGSYWLCHKKNIYKFIFRYHHTIRNTTQFSYGRELLKIIRRIIKCHPTQGQQFGTQHLLVTYNCTSWTRQDKMFAILKFQQRTNAAAFSHAFVLTIRMCSSSKHLLLDLKYPTNGEAEAGYGREYIKNILNQDTKTINFNLQGNMNNANFYENLDARINNSAITNEVYLVNKHNTELFENKSMNYKEHKRNMKQYPTDCIEEQSLGSTKKIDEIEKTGSIDEKTESIQKQKQKIQTIQKYKVFSSMERPLTKIMKSIDKSLLNRSNFDENSIEKDNINNEDNLNDKKKNSETVVDPNNIPYQYFIEKEIEDAKHTARFISNTLLAIDQPMQENLQAEVKNSNENSSLKVIKINNDESMYTKQKEYNKITDLKSQESDEQHTKTSVSTDDNQSQNNTYNKLYKARKQKSREPEKKTVSNDKILRSSNITDLVMEGLMFTIRQDQDSVAVIEQKTKLEVDEVLENSVKVETKAGEKCLLNSSLLRLENMVTMIDLPNDKNKEHKTDDGISNKAHLSSFNIFSNGTICNLDVNHIDGRMDKSSVVSYDRHSVTDLNLCETQQQHQCISSSITNSYNYSMSEHVIEESEQLMVGENNKKYEPNRKDKNDIKMKKGEDIIPKVLQSTMFPIKATNTKLQDKDLPINDINMGETDKCDMSVKKYSSLLPPSLSKSNKMLMKEISIIPKESGLPKIPRQKANIPRIVSDTAITIDQMPIALQKVLQHTCKTRKYSSTNDGTLQHEWKMQHTALDTTSTMDVSLGDKYANSNITNNLLSIKSFIDSEEIKNNKNESCIIIHKDASKINEAYVRNIKKNNEIHRLSQRNSLSKHNSSRKLQDITEDFYYDLLHLHNKDSAIWQKCLRQRQKTLDSPRDIKHNKIRIEMLKFIQDITEGARVVVKRLNINKPIY